MNVLVLNQARAVLKGLPTLLTLIGFLAGVDSLAANEEVLWPEGFPTFVIFIGLVPWMDFPTKSKGCLRAERGHFFRPDDHLTQTFIWIPPLSVKLASALPVVWET